MKMPLSGDDGTRSNAVSLAPVMWVGFGALAIGLSVLTGWYLRAGWLKSFGAGDAAMRPSTALGLTAAGIALIAHATGRSRRVARVAAGCTIAVGVAAVVEHAGGWPFERIVLVDVFRVPDAPAISTMQLAGAICLIAAGAGLAFTRSRSTRLPSMFALVAAIPPAVVLMSYVMETGRITPSINSTRPALITVLGLLIVSAAIWWAQENSTAHIFVAGGPIATLLRRLLPVALVGTVLFGWIRIIAYRRGLFSAEFSVALGIVETAGLFAALVLGGARSLQKRDDARREAAALTAKREGQLAEAQRVAYMGSFERDIKTGESEWSDAMFDLLGYEKSTVPSYEAFISRVLDSDRRRVEHAIMQAIETGSSFEEEFTIVKPHGERRVLFARGQVVTRADGESERIHGAVLDVTDRRRVEAALIESEDRYRIIVEGAAEGIWTSDSFGETTLVNPRMAEMLGYELDEIKDLPLTAFLAGDGRELIRRVNARRRAGYVDRYEVELVRKDGSTFWVQVTANPMRSLTGKFLGSLALVTDISARKEAEETLRAAYDREREALENMRAVDQMKNAFLAAVSHELRTPLTGVIGFASTLHDRAESLPASDRTFMLERLLLNAQRLDKLLSDLLDLDRLSRGILEPKRRLVHVDELIRLVVDQVDDLSHTLVVDVMPGMSAYIDGPKVERIVENLINNAIRHTPQGTRVEVRARPAEGGFVLSVEDDGPGVPDEEKRSIFEPFTTGSNSRPHSPGTGIGLSLVARFADLHGGRCWVSDRLGGGSSFAVFLPHGESDPVHSGSGAA